MAAISNNNTTPLFPDHLNFTYHDCFTGAPLENDGVYLLPCNHTTSHKIASALFGEMINGEFAKKADDTTRRQCPATNPYSKNLEWCCKSPVIGYYPQFAKVTQTAAATLTTSTATAAAEIDTKTAAAEASIVPKNFPKSSELFKENAKPIHAVSTYLEFLKPSNTSSFIQRLWIQPYNWLPLTFQVGQKNDGIVKELNSLINFEYPDFSSISNGIKDKNSCIKFLNILFANKEFSQIDEEKIKRFLNHFWKEQVFAI